MGVRFARAARARSRIARALSAQAAAPAALFASARSWAVN
ncbi:hypothetical protein D8O27_22730 [Burkholderia mallei]|uniref:Uncharacterized protein n=3 Tax=Burkholderia mallei TaxID=13373 RepID=A2SA90_BURM9|nr:hypothetical protein BMA0638 [Burkholderia mallei ATCC 23344]ABM50514.1 hypothetical protein BMASAVP1_A2374 [Burkholderia mallei SAVP1]ABN03533.1 hypothetical protein BMA10229_A2913 [Burkholderia mallei NCTC 10229]ABO04446.1 hypothetical protein BMA10247_1689 [Burkholderia mallei NCTC 10247]AYE28104.1 hypothetical protein CNX72_12645 [Burkholderia pseudomallei]EDK55990.1 hypothetical protein BMAFMH_C0139 [Burkholderia mallei FMH]EDK60141.1 hypothetical protein BMAJHU_C0143 [Burkholderia ma